MMTRILGRKLRPPIKYFGGKHYLARRILALMPAHRVYVEPFFGGGSVLLSKDPSPVEVAADIDGRLVGMWRVVRDLRPELSATLARFAYSEDSFMAAQNAIVGGDVEIDSVAGAAAFLIRSRMSRGGLGRDFGWSDRLRGKRRPGGPVPGDVNAWDTARAGLPSVAARVRYVKLIAGPALTVIREYDRPDTVIYCDPPYLPESRTVKKAYEHEMTREDHEVLLGVLADCRGTVMLSGYASDLYDSRLAGWARHTFDLPNHSGQTKAKQRRIEILWIKEPRR